MTKEDSQGPYTVDLFADQQLPLSTAGGLTWPDGRRFPLNLDTAKVEDTLLPDLYRAGSPLIVSGYASLDRMIDFVTGCKE